MQLLLDPPNEARVIHVIRREVPGGVLNPFGEASSNGSGSHEQRPSALGGGLVTTYPEPLFEDQGDIIMHVPGQYLHEEPAPAPPSPPTNPLRQDSFNLDLAAQGYNSPFQSTFSFADTGANAGLNPQEENNYDVIGTSYPEYMFDTLSFTSDQPPESRDYYPLWRYILEYWFPSTSGFEVVQDWDPKSSYGYRVVHQDSWDEGPPKPLPSFAVFDTALPAEPFLFVFIPSEPRYACDLTRMQARETAEEGFETLRACSFTADFKSLCVVSTIEAKWGMFIRDPSWIEGESGFDCVGQWEEDVTSDESFGVMGYCFQEMKKDIVAMRR